MDRRPMKMMHLSISGTINDFSLEQKEILKDLDVYLPLLKKVLHN